MQRFLVFSDLIVLLGIRRTSLLAQSPGSRSHVEGGEGADLASHHRPVLLGCLTSGRSHLRIPRWSSLTPPFLPSVTWAATNAINQAKPDDFPRCLSPSGICSAGILSIPDAPSPPSRPPVPDTPKHCPHVTSFLYPDTDAYTFPSS